MNPSGIREILFYDLETTGLDKKRCSVIQFGGVVVDPISLDIIEERSIKLLPKEKSWIDPEACAINGYDRDKWVADGAVHWAQAAPKIYDIMKDRTLAGHNIKRFDNEWMLEFFDMSVKGMVIFDRAWESFFNNSIDTLQIARDLKISELVDVRGKGLWSLALAFGVVTPESIRGNHDALEDCRLTVGVYREMMKRYGEKISKLL